MDDPIATTARPGPVAATLPTRGSPDGPAVSWGAIFAGAAGAAALSLIFFVLGTGLGLASVSPWSSQGVSATAFGASTIVWISFVALVASGVGGYLAGRLRTKWVGTHTDEVYFRDTAHGFLAWAVATLATAAFLSSTIGAIVATGAEAGGSIAGAVGSTALTAGGAAAAGTVRGSAEPSPLAGADLGYFTDALFRSGVATPAGAASSPGGATSDASTTLSTTTSTSAATTASTTAEVGRIFLRSLRNGALAPEDQRYVSQLVAQRTGLSPQDADKRVADTYARAQSALQDAQTKAKEAADKARRAGAYASLWIFVSLLLGAFTASLAATFGGRQRDL